MKPFHSTRRSVLLGGLAACIETMAPVKLNSLGRETAEGRASLADRKFSSPVIESFIAGVQRQIADPKLSAMFERCFPNTLDTTVFPGTWDGLPDTFVITGRSEERRVGKECRSRW